MDRAKVAGAVLTGAPEGALSRTLTLTTKSAEVAVAVAGAKRTAEQGGDRMPRMMMMCGNAPMDIICVGVATCAVLSVKYYTV